MSTVERSPASALADVPCERRRLGCYTGLYEGEAWTLAPRNIDELRQAFAYAAGQGRRVTMRAAGHSFDNQSIGDDIAISMEHFDSIDLLEGNRVRVGACARWGRIFAELEPRGLAPAVTVTTEEATAGGTLSGDCLSRFSPAYGKEGEWIESFELLTPSGDLLECTEPPAETDWQQMTPGQRAYLGAIGGFGYLGAVTSIVYRLLDVGESGGQIGVRSVVRKYETYARLASDLVPATQQAYLEDSDPNDSGKLDAIWSGLVTGRDGSQRALLFTARFTPEPKRRRMVLHRPKLLIRVPFEWLMRVPWISRASWSLVFRFVYRGDQQEYIDDFEGFTFFMDGNARAKRVGKRFGFAMRNIQQTFVVPFDPASDGPNWRAGQDRLVEWLDLAHGVFTERGLQPTLHDVLFLPADSPFLLSATAAGPGFAVSYAFETSRRSTLEGAKEAFTELSDLLWQRFRGRTHLVKNVFVREETLAEMYRESAQRFFALKGELDPQAVLRNEFLERNFGALLDAYPVS